MPTHPESEPSNTENFNLKAEKWKEQNAAALEASNIYTEKNGIPLAKYRLF